MKTLVILSCLVGTGFVFAQNSLSERELDPESSKSGTQSQDDDTIYVFGSEDAAFYTPGSAQFISSEKLKKFKHTDPGKILSEVPGVYVQEEDGFGLRPNIGLRGATAHRSKKITLMEDGVLIAPAPYSAPAAYHFPNMQRISDIEVFKGVTSVRFGPNSIGGAVNFLTPNIPEKTQSEVLVSAGDIQKIQLSSGGRTGEFGGLVSYNRAESSGFKTLADGTDTGFERNDFMLKLTRDLPGRQHKINLKLGYANEDSNETYLGLADQDFGASPFSRYQASTLDRLESNHKSAMLSYSKGLGASTIFKAKGYLNQFERNWSKLNGFRNGVFIGNYLDSGSADFDPLYLRVLRGEANSSLASGDDQLLIGNNDRTYESSGINLGLEYEWEQNSNVEHLLKVDLRLHQDSVERRHTIDSYAMTEGSLVATDLRKSPSTQNKDRASARTVVLQDEITIGENWNVTVGGRFEDVKNTRVAYNEFSTSSESSYQIFAPGAGLEYHPNENLNFILGVNKGVSTVAPGQAEGIDPEESTNYEFGVKAKGKVRASVIGFYNDYTNIKGFCSFSTGCDETNLDNEFNGGKAQIYGLESSVGIAPRYKKFDFPIELNYTATVAKFDSELNSDNREWGIGQVRVGDPIPYIPRHKVSFNLGFNYRNFRSYLNYQWQSSVFDQAVQENRKTIASYGVLSLGSSYDYSKQGAVFLKLTNAADEVYEVSRRPFGLRPGAPRMLEVGTSYVF